MPTDSARQALSILRDPGQFSWYVIPLLAIAVYIYSAEIEKKNWNVVFAGLAFWGMDWFNEIWNSLVFHFTNYAPVWGAPGKTAFLILIGLNIEICFMFSIAGVAMSKTLIFDKSVKILGIPNRLFIAIAGAIFCVFVEIVLNLAGQLTWEYCWWSVRVPWLIFFIGYLPFYLVSFWVYDMETARKKAATVGTIFAVDIICIIIFAVFLKWI
ncbi:MAG: hypothetical protein WCX65_02620 [bacterium]